MATTSADKSAELRRYLESSVSVQRKMAALGVAGILLSLGLRLAAGSGAALAALALTILVAGCGLWITQGHIADFRQQLDELDVEVPGR